MVLDNGLVNVHMVYAPHSRKPEEEKENFWNEVFHLYLRMKWIHATSTNKCLHYFVHATLYTITFPVYPLLTTSTLY